MHLPLQVYQQPTGMAEDIFPKGKLPLFFSTTMKYDWVIK
jgi:hypothetical protein